MYSYICFCVFLNRRHYLKNNIDMNISKRSFYEAKTDSTPTYVYKVISDLDSPPVTLTNIRI